ncbi:MAG: hypothetical protein AAF206_04795 [Bacteroidota bacterium]
MDSYEILKNIHKVGHPVSGVVTGYKMYSSKSDFPRCHIEVQTNSVYRSVLPFGNLFDEHQAYDKDLLPPIGSTLEMVVSNHSEGTLYLSARPKDLAKTEVQAYKDFYQLIEALETGSTMTGRIEQVRPFGIFVDLGLPFVGLIDVGNSEFNRGVRLPYDHLVWPKEGEHIQCILAYFRFWNRQLGLGWIPES